MTAQITVRLPEDLVAFIDSAVADGRARSRAAVVTSALQREVRRQAGERDAAILAASGPADDLDALVAWSAVQPTTVE